MATIADRVPIVASLLGGRTDQNTNISNWILNSYRDVASAVPFEELELTQTTLSVANINTVPYPFDARGIKFITLGFPAANPTSFRPLWKRNVGILDRYAPTPTGVPAIWAPFNNQILLAQTPDNNYPLIIRYWQKVVPDPLIQNNTVLKVPDDWLEIIDYAAQERGLIDFQDMQKANDIHILLWGDPANRKKNPGLIRSRLTRIQAEYMGASYGFRPRIYRFSHVK